MLSSQLNVSLLLTEWSDQSVNLGAVDLVQFLDSKTNLGLVSSQVSDEHKSVVVFDFLHGRLGGKWVLDDGEAVHSTNKNKHNSTTHHSISYIFLENEFKED